MAQRAMAQRAMTLDPRAKTPAPADSVVGASGEDDPVADADDVGLELDASTKGDRLTASLRSKSLLRGVPLGSLMGRMGALLSPPRLSGKRSLN